MESAADADQHRRGGVSGQLDLCSNIRCGDGCADISERWRLRTNPNAASVLEKKTFRQKNVSEKCEELLF